MLTKEYVSAINERVSNFALAQSEGILKDVVRMGRDSPTVVNAVELNHYESIGLVLYSMKDQQATSGKYGNG